MSMRALFTELSQFTNLLNTVNDSGRALTQQQIQKVQDPAGVLGGAAGITGAAINTPIRGMTAANVKEILKAFSVGTEALGNGLATVAKGKTIADQSKKSLAERCDLARLQQEDGNRSSSYSQMIQAIQGIQSAKARLTS
ncbi:MAG: hypothetical protein NTX49_00165 [Chlamydiae bacterium]|nr:hypothetical protein [Chlamydiota bacterium]